MTTLLWLVTVVVGAGCTFALGYACCIINLIERVLDRRDRRRRRRLMLSEAMADAVARIRAEKAAKAEKQLAGWEAIEE